MKDKIQKHRYEHFQKRITNRKSHHLAKLSDDIYQNRNFIRPNTITREEAISEAARSQSVFVGTLKKGENVHIVDKTRPNIIVGEVYFIGKTTFKIKNDNRFYQLSEIITIG